MHRNAFVFQQEKLHGLVQRPQLSLRVEVQVLPQLVAKFKIFIIVLQATRFGVKRLHKPKVSQKNIRVCQLRTHGVAIRTIHTFA